MARDKASKKILLIDGNSLFHRAYHALPPITDRSGEVANAVFGFSNMLLKAINEVNPDYIACAFDTAAPTFRHIEFEKYKAQRVEPPPDLYPQLPKVKKVLDAFGIKYFEKEGYEADDVLATLASKCKGKSAKGKVDQVVILSGDRDTLQLVDGDIKVQMPSFTSASAKATADKKATEGKPGWGELVGEKEVKEKYGITPAQMVDFKSLMGDASDNIPGIAGIGPKTASSLLQKYRTLENLFRHVKETSLKVREKLEAGKDDALKAKQLVELDRDVDLRFTINDLRFDPNWERVRAEYQQLGFKSIVAKIPGGGDTSEVKSGRNQENTSEVGKVKKKRLTTDSNQLELI